MHGIARRERHYQYLPISICSAMHEAPVVGENKTVTGCWIWGKAISHSTQISPRESSFIKFNQVIELFEYCKSKTSISALFKQDFLFLSGL